MDTSNGKCRFKSRLCNLIELNIQLVISYKKQYIINYNASSI